MRTSNKTSRFRPIRNLKNKNENNNNNKMSLRLFKLKNKNKIIHTTKNLIRI